MLIDKLAYSSPLAKKSPSAKILYGVATLTVCLLFNSIFVSISVFIIMWISTVSIARVRAKKYITLLLLPFSFLLIGTVTIIIGQHEIGTNTLLGVVIGSYEYGITASSLFAGIQLIMRAMSSISCMYFISLSTPMLDILAVLRKIKIPALLLTLMELIYRYIFVILEEADKIRTSQQARMGYNGFRHSIRSAGELLGTLFFRSIDRCDRVYSALQSRGYEGEFQILNPNHERANGFIIAAIFINIMHILIWLADKV